jgi:pyruvate dehydrogenase E2 component (dihydrolipoamide acetyltransferase)
MAATTSSVFVAVQSHPDVIAVVDTTKAAIDDGCCHDGVVDRLVTQVGEKVPVRTVMALLRAPGEAAAATPQGAAPRRQRATPAARQRAVELGVDLASIVGTGDAGAITRADVEQAATSVPTDLAPKSVPAPTPKAAPIPAPTMTDRAVEMRKSIAAAMSRSKREIPHYYLSETVPMRRALDWPRGANAERPVTARLLPAVLLLKAVALTVRDFPEMNGQFADGVFRPASAAHIGVAISLRQGGLVAPALHDVGSKPLDELMRELADLVKRCRACSLRSSEMSDATITVTNLGDEGVFGVIHPPQVALVGFGRVADRPWIDDGAVVTMPVLCATLAADHRVSDGHRGAMFLARLRDRLQAPDELQGERRE